MKNVANSTSIYKTLQNLSSWYPNAKNLWLDIDNKKEKFNSNWTKSEMIESLILSKPGENTYEFNRHQIS